MKARIKEKNEIAKLTLEVKYELIEGSVDFTPGQYFFVTLLNAPYKDGGKDPVHHFTITNTPAEKGIMTQATRLRDTAFKNSLREMEIGSEVVLDRIGGKFVLPQSTGKPLCFIALGIGVTPYISMLRQIRENNLDYKVVLIYSDSDKESMAYLTELQDYAKINPNFKIFLTITRDPDWTGEKRHIGGDLVKEYLKEPKNYLFYISGPPGAVKAVASALEEGGIAKENLKTENFSGY